MALTQLRAGAFPSGSVVQTQVTTKTDSFSSSGSSTAYEDITGLSVSITQSSTSNKILIVLSLGFSINPSGHGDFKILRGSTDIQLPTVVGNRISAHGHTYGATSYNDHYDVDAMVVQLLDSPSTTSSTTYKVQVGTPNSAGYVIHVNTTGEDSNNNYNGRTVSTITAMEIKG